MSTVKERLIKFIDYKGLNKNRFEQLCGLSTRYVSNISVSIQPDKVERISLIFPELNTGWLLTGEGEMLRQTSTVGLDEEPKIGQVPVTWTMAQIDELLNQNGRLLKIIENLTTSK